MHTQIEAAIDYIRTLTHVDFMLESSGGKPGADAKAAIERALQDFKPSMVTRDDVEYAAEGFAGPEDPECTAVNLARAAVTYAASVFAGEQLEGEWGGDVTDGCAFIAMI